MNDTDTSSALVTDGHIICHAFESRYGGFDHSIAVIADDGSLRCADMGIAVPADKHMNAYGFAVDTVEKIGVMPTMFTDAVRVLSIDSEIGKKVDERGAGPFALASTNDGSFIDFVEHSYAASEWIQQNLGVKLCERDSRRFFQDLSLIDTLDFDKPLIRDFGDKARDEIMEIIGSCESKRQAAFDMDYFEGRLMDDLNVKKEMSGCEKRDKMLGLLHFADVDDAEENEMFLVASCSEAVGFAVGNGGKSGFKLDDRTPVSLFFSSRDGWTGSRRDGSDSVPLDPAAAAVAAEETELDVYACAAFAALDIPVPVQLAAIVDKCNEVLAKCDAIVNTRGCGSDEELDESMSRFRDELKTGTASPNAISGGNIATTSASYTNCNVIENVSFKNPVNIAQVVRDAARNTETGTAQANGTMRL